MWDTIFLSLVLGCEYVVTRQSQEAAGHLFPLTYKLVYRVPALAQFPARCLIFWGVIRADWPSVATSLVQVDQFFAYMGVMLPRNRPGLPQVAGAIPLTGSAKRVGVMQGSCFAAFNGLQCSRL